MKRSGVVAVLILLLCCFGGYAEVVLPKILGNGMVLQREKPVPIWGTAAAGEKVTVKFNKQTKTTTADAAGNWKLMLDAMPASAKGATLTISGTNTIKLTDILVGEVWLCSGQSNMLYEMRKNSKVNKPDTMTTAYSPVDEIEHAHNPQIRIFLVTQKNLAKPDSTHSGWSIAQDSALRAFSAAGYFFAKNLNHDLNVPVGVVCAAVSGSRIEPWIPETAFAESPYFKRVSKDSAQVSGADGKFWHRMISPLAPLAIRGFLWYQGEANMTETVSYIHKMQLLINSWRDAWHEPTMPFYYVEIVPYYYSKMKSTVTISPQMLPRFWETQSQVQNIPNTGMIITTDLNDDVKNLHPPFKWEVGRRLELLALAKTYKKPVVYSGPVYKQMHSSENKIILEFTGVSKGLISRDGKPLNYFTIAGTDGVFVDANAVIKGNTIEVSTPSVSKPTAVRFAWSEDAQPNFYNKDGFPAAPFRTDNPLKFNPTDN
ncbi:sialate O-acetylesterase [Mucilaginibacter boryungensis]|uniref:Sialate O-acetylesterase n=1 Tax=Mucilaginibacter boryungensis TaxID=768480 RepID=A0ABR9XCZ0_9SPHI|nr:sialate O-acetylesterase [Mucilaginibacter boryungensis]MBE9665267.1 sialate O-acetylesterase [Mucilaginibacter boryungensis]